MSEIKLSQLPEVISLSSSDILPNVASGVTSKITLQNLAGTMPQVSSSISSSYALTASYALNGGGGGGSTFPFNGNAVITGSLVISNQTNSQLIQPFINSDVDTGIEIVASVPTSSYDAAFFDYVIKNGSNYRAGTLVAVWSSTTWSYYDASVTDIGNTSGVIMDADVYDGNIRLRATANSNNWTIKTVVRTV